MKIFVIGGGSFGTALANVSSENNKVTIYSIENDVIENINKKHQNTKYLPKIKLNKSITATNTLSEIKNSEIIIIATPSNTINTIINQIKPFYTNQYIISTAKGITKEGKILTEEIKNNLGANEQKILALSGPNIALELAKKHPASTMLAGNKSSTKKLKSVLENDYFIIKTTTDIEGIQLLGFYKNIIAILVGICDELKLGNNFKAALIAKAYSEFYYLNINKNITRHSFVDFAGIGDLFVTLNAKESRNIKFGKLIARGLPIPKIKQQISQTIEGYDNLLLLNQLKDKQYIDENLLQILIKIINTNPKREEIQNLLTKYLKSNNIKTIIFDWGGVLTEGNYLKKVCITLEKKYNYPAQKMCEYFTSKEKQILIGKQSFQKYFEEVKKEYPKLEYDYVKNLYINSITLERNMIKFCKELKTKYNLYILSNNYTLLTDYLKKSELKDIFQGMIFSNEINLAKPSTEIYKYTLNKYKLRPENCVFVDDMIRNTKAAESLKLNAITFKNINQLKQEFSERFNF